MTSSKDFSASKNKMLFLNTYLHADFLAVLRNDGKIDLFAGRGRIAAGPWRQCERAD